MKLNKNDMIEEIHHYMSNTSKKQIIKDLKATKSMNHIKNLTKKGRC